MTLQELNNHINALIEQGHGDKEVCVRVGTKEYKDGCYTTVSQLINTPEVVTRTGEIPGLVTYGVYTMSI